jgi:hypothetical protein
MALKSVTVTIERTIDLNEEPYPELCEGLSQEEIISMAIRHFHEDMYAEYQTLDYPSATATTKEQEDN